MRPDGYSRGGVRFAPSEDSARMTGRFASMGIDKAGLIDEALERLSPLETECTLCPRICRVDRTAAATGICRTGALARVSHALLHFGEEPVLSGHEDCSRTVTAGARGSGGSGTVFFGGCNLKCLFCQNYQLSWLDEGRPVADAELAAMMLDLQAQGALNINLVSPTHVVLPILRALRIAWTRGGISVPLVYNSNGYDSPDVVARLDGIVDIYLPDLKYVVPRLVREIFGRGGLFREGCGRAPRDVRPTAGPGARREGHRPEGSHRAPPGPPRPHGRLRRGPSLDPRAPLPSYRIEPHEPVSSLLQGARRAPTARVVRGISPGGRYRPWSWASKAFSFSRKPSLRTSTGSRISTGKSPSTGNEVRDSTRKSPSKDSGTSLLKTRIFPSEENPLRFGAALSPSLRTGNRARSAPRRLPPGYPLRPSCGDIFVQGICDGV